MTSHLISCNITHYYSHLQKIHFCASAFALIRLALSALSGWDENIFWTNDALELPARVTNFSKAVPML